MDKKPTILIVDDEPMNQDILGCLFEDDCVVLAAKNGEQALERARGQNRPDVILLDVIMPGMDGYEVCRRLKADQRTKDIPVVFVTAMSEVGDETRGLELGAVDYIAKPISPPIVKARVHGLVTREHLRKRLEELQREYTAMIVHDVRSPLSIVYGFAELVLNNPLVRGSEQLQKDVERILENAERASRLVCQMLDLSQLQAGKVRLAKTSTNLTAGLADIAVEHRLLAHGKGVDLVQDLQPGLEAQVDSAKLREVIANLLGNALKFTPQGGRITLRAANGEDGHLRVSVSDTGPGIPAEQARALFAPWSQADEGTKQVVRGYGLGLAICKMIVEAHGGSIWVESEAGRGSTFAFWIPRA